MIKCPAMCDADVWIKLSRVDEIKLIFSTFAEIKMAGIVEKEVKQFRDCNKPKNNLQLHSSDVEIIKQKNFSPEKLTAFRYVVAQYKLTHNLTGNKSLGEIVSAMLAQELNVPYIVSDDGFVNSLSKDFNLTLYTHYDILNHCQDYHFIKRNHADRLFQQIEKLGTPKKQSRSFLNKLKKK